ncbi:DoxX family protein [Chitinophaga lutea]|uniref:DoxX family protein n=1 Tax=Chitinophaga lutea TaxID=2488634 RepID=A0A3N4QAA3_9BACT|nr:DoxX family protein [Chitinophaga lutea]RPE12957.1 DoxX family protein [Chitinophaga lutea]
MFKVPAQSSAASTALLVLRIVVGIAFILHGWGKIQTPTNWVPPGGPITLSPLLQLLAAVSEFGGGILLAIGLFTPIAALAIGITMAVAVYFHAVIFKDPFVNMTGGGAFELPLVYFSIMLLILFAGPGKISADYKFFGKR